MKFPNEIYVSIENPNTPDRYLQAVEEKAKAIDEDGPTMVATYRLVVVERLGKIVQHINRSKHPPLNIK